MRARRSILTPAVRAVENAPGHLGEIPDNWFRAKYRSKSEALSLLFGEEWQAVYVPRPAASGAIVHGYFLTVPGDPSAGVIDTVFHNDPVGWFNPYEAPDGVPEHPLCPVTDHFEPGKVALTWDGARSGGSNMRRAALARVMHAARPGADLAALLHHLACDEAAIEGATEAFGLQRLRKDGAAIIVEARLAGVFDQWLEHQIQSGASTEADADGFRLLRALDPSISTLQKIIFG